MKNILVLFFLVFTGCADPVERPVTHDHGASVTYIQSSFSERFTQPEAFQQVGVSFDSEGELEYEENAVWKVAPITFSEGKMKVAVIKLASPQNTIRFRSTALFEHASFQFYKDIVAKPEEVPAIKRTRLTRALAPVSFVIPRAEWGARNPDKRCGRDHTPKYLTVHHTALPDNDGPDPAARLRQMQAYHIDSNGWCDIGYHFIISQSGKVYRGMSSEKRTGIHVRNHNFENIGVSLIGNFEEQNLDGAQLDALVKILGWVATEYNIPFQRPDFRGHREWAGASTDCPGTNTLNKLDEIIRLAAESAVDKPPTPCSMIGALGGEIDNDSDCFQTFGPSEFWRTETQGFGGSLLWTNVIKADSPENWARWNINLEKEGLYKIEYYSVPEFALYSSTQYRLAHAETEVGITVDQSVGIAGWNSLGEFEFNQGADQWLAMYDYTPFLVEEGQHIIADAIRLTPVAKTSTNNNTTNTTPTTNTGSNNNPNNSTNNNTTSNNANTSTTVGTTNEDVSVEGGCATTPSSNGFFFLFGILVFFGRKKNKSKKV